MIIVATIAIILKVVLCTIAYYRVFCEEVMDNLKAYTELLSDADPGYISAYAKDLSEANIRVTLIDPEGKVVFDNVADVTGLENHRSRAEIADAYKKGRGTSIRKSTTINKSNFYYAVKLDDGSILRAAKQTSSIYNIFGHAFPVVLGIALVLIGVCIMLSHFLTKSILRPIKEMAEDMTAPKSTPYKELDPILQHIRSRHEEILNSARMRQEFTANVSHELKTPLTSILGYSELIENGMVSEKDVREFAKKIHDNSDRLLLLINDIIRLSELDAGDIAELRFEEVDIYETAMTCQAMLEAVAEKQDVEIVVEGESSVVEADKTMIEELVFNLCDNAVRYNKRGGKVVMRVKDCAITVKDTGIGIPEECRDRIFERFFRVDKSRSKERGGTGLGLAIVKHIAELHGAKLDLKSEEGKGTEISVTFYQKRLG